MENETNQTTFDINVYFVLPNKYECNEECNEDMWDAYHKCAEWDINPDWIPEKKCLKLKPSKKDVFVMEEFQGEIFDKLQSFKCTIVGPRCLISCFLSAEPIPEGTTPVFNTAMRGIVVTASGFNASIKEEIKKIIEYMGGIFTKQLRASVTHLVTDNVMSAKYERAVELQRTIVTIEWLKSVWDTNLKDNVLANDPLFNKYKCPVFLNLFVTSTNLNKCQKEEIKKLINSNGGEFMGVLDGSKIKIVITVETSSLSEKLKFAMQNNIPCLKVEWVYESLAAGYSLPFNNYLIKSTQACSTPEKSAAEPFNFSTISMIPADNHNQYVDETVASATVLSSTVMNSTVSAQNVPVIPKNNYITIMERLNIAEAKRAGTFLDGCNIYLTGFSSTYRDKLNKIVNVGSATRLDEISDALTHVIVGDPISATHDLRMIKSKGLNPYILKVDWLEECLKLQAPAPEENFLFYRKDANPETPAEPPSPLSKKNLQLLRPKIPAAPVFTSNKKKDNQPKNPTKDEHSEIVQQYLQQTSSEPDNTLRKMLKLPNNENFGNNFNTSSNQTLAERWNESTRKDNDITRKDNDTTRKDNDTTRKENETTFNTELRDDSMIPISQESFIQKMLKGLVFMISGFQHEESLQLVEQIRNLGGKIVSKSYTGIPDYGIVPTLGTELKNTVGEIVTDLFIEDCIDCEKLVSVEYYHRPIVLSNNTKPLSDCVIGMSTYSGAERMYLSRLSEALGARYQDTFARKTNLQKNTYSSTHLVCPKPQGDKYGAAVKWGLPAVNAEWLIDCAKEMKFLDETGYLVGETMAPERTIVSTNSNVIKCNDSSMMKPPNENVTKRQTLTIADQFMGGSCETPVINKRLNNLINNKTPQSPFHISTPETPYGQIFKENPSPRTRKAWVKWIDHFPDVPMETPPPKRKRSTPLSDIKRMAWDFVTGRLDSQETNVSNRVETKTTVETEPMETNEPASSDIHTNRKLSFSEENSPNKSTMNPAISFQLAQLDKMLQRASSNTPESRSSANGDHSNPYHLEQNFPQGTCLVKESQPDSVGWEDPVKRVPPQRRSVINEVNENSDLENIVNDEEVEEELNDEVAKPKFMFSGIKDKGMAEQLIKELGGEVSNLPAYDPTATHLLCSKPARNEKILSSIAAGKWVLHYSYIEACKDQNKLLDEEEYELGNPKSKGVIPDPSSENERTIMNAAHRWRLKLLENPGGAFKFMVALLLTPKEKYEQFERLINAGGGTVVTAKPPYDGSPKGRKITHCFIQLKQIDQQVDWAMMASKGIMCFPPQYLNEHLMSESLLNPRDCVLPEFQKYLALMPK